VRRRSLGRRAACACTRDHGCERSVAQARRRANGCTEECASRRGGRNREARRHGWGGRCQRDGSRATTQPCPRAQAHPGACAFRRGKVTLNGGAPVRGTERRRGSIEVAKGTTLPQPRGVRVCAGARLARVHKIRTGARGNVSALASRPRRRARTAVALRQTNRCKKRPTRTVRARRCRQQHLQERLPSLARWPASHSASATAHMATLPSAR
jgi:hypothetical protein